MREKLYTSAGFYYSSYFRINVDTNDAFLNFDESLSELGAAIFFHEYIHFLQDITTTHGLFNIASEVDFIKFFNSKLQKDGVNSINVPLVTSIEDGNTHVNMEMKKIFIGAGEHKNFDQDYIINNELYNLTINGVIWTFTKEFIQVGNEREGGFKYYFGSYCICEGMAYEMEQLLYPNVILPNPTKLPYSAPRLVADKLYPIFSKNTENLIALCDASLMYNDPGMVFCLILRQMNATGYYPQSPEEIYDYVFNVIEFEFQKIKKPLELFYYAGHIVNSQLSDYFRSNIYKSNNLWIARTISASQNFRTQRPSFMLDIVRNGDIRNNIFFKAVKGKIGTPIIVNNNNEMFFENVLNGFGVEIEPQYFWVFSQIRELITRQWNDLGRINLCGLKDYCDKGNEENPFTDIRCRNEPWSRSNDENNDLCNFGATWKSWALQGKSLTNE
ncbi:hypothetical protein [Cellulophaga sp. BC115SP]|uniref:hypothetical protein n=1 Tax=Cellulophaga sp. BC115SP TaxID=2683263 RepID=UPI0014122300|nr:hypothetical protein [Cellulophaga sp. BC115SP]NBB30221.1 hypothetical protein [Cellulophaga sp. BC115SP]